MAQEKDTSMIPNIKITVVLSPEIHQDTPRKKEGSTRGGMWHKIETQIRGNIGVPRHTSEEGQDPMEITIKQKNMEYLGVRVPQIMITSIVNAIAVEERDTCQEIAAYLIMLTSAKMAAAFTTPHKTA